MLIALLGCGDETVGPVGPPPPPIGSAGDGTLNAVLESARAQYGLPALAAISIRGNQVVERGAAGLRAVGSAAEVGLDDRWHIGSLTKAMTATLAGILVERGEISWDVRIAEVLPELVGSMRPAYEDVTLRELLSHTGGLPTDVTQAPSWPTLRSAPGPLLDRRLAFVDDLLTLPPAGSRGSYAYSNAGYIIAGAMLERRTNRLWEDLLRDEVLTPLGMSATGFGAPGTAGATPDQPRGHVRQGTAWVPIAPGPNADNPDVLGPAGTVNTTLDDYAKYMMAHLAGARGEDGLVKATTFATLHAAVSGSGYALGWGVTTRSWARGTVLQHSGSNTLWYAVVWIAPERNLAMFAATNAGGDAGAQGTDRAIQVLLQRFEAVFP